MELEALGLSVPDPKPEYKKRGRKLLAEVFEENQIEVCTYGNMKAAIARKNCR